jgi:cell division initiation protein
MRLSALDVKKKEFQQKMRGFDPEEVQPYLAQVSEEIELLMNERRDADDRRADIEKQLAHYLHLEQTLERTLVAAQQTAVKIEEQAKKEAELILREADLQRDRKLNDIRLDLQRAESDLLRVRSEYESTLARLRSILEGFGKFLQSIDNDKLAGTQTERFAPEEHAATSGPEAARALANIGL